MIPEHIGAEVIVGNYIGEATRFEAKNLWEVDGVNTQLKNNTGTQPLCREEWLMRLDDESTFDTIGAIKAVYS